MGCDIHDYAEVRKNGKWVKAGKVFINPYHDPAEPKTDAFWAKMTEHPFSTRDYDLFAILAGVRDYREATPRIATAPRGLPPDVSKAVKKRSDAFGVNGHSHSWVGLDEILAFDWNQIVEDAVYLNAEEYILHKAGKREQGGSLYSFHTFLLSKEHMDELIQTERGVWPQLLALLGGRPDSTPIVGVGIKTPLTELVNDFLTRTVPALKKLGNPEDVRMVFWFDN